MHPPTVVSVEPGTFELSASVSFFDDLGDVINSHPELEEGVSAFLESLVAQPYDPSIVSECIYVNEANDFFRYVWEGKILFEWDTTWVGNPDSPSLVAGANWQVNFLKCRYIGPK